METCGHVGIQAWKVWRHAGGHAGVWYVDMEACWRVWRHAGIYVSRDGRHMGM